MFTNFPVYRPGQAEVIDLILSSDKKYRIISAPTGIGKTLIGMSLCDLYGKSTYTVTTKILQDQIYGDFPEAVILKGRNNYPCERFEAWGLNADSCVKKGCDYLDACQYELTKGRAKSAHLRGLNLSYLLYETNLGPGNFSGQDLIVIDEADHLEQTLVNFIALTLTKQDQIYLRSHQVRVDPEYLTKPESWKPWTEHCLSKLRPRHGQLKSAVESGSIRDMEILTEYKRIKRLLEKLGNIYKYSDDTWIRYEDGGNIHYKPIWLTPQLTELFLFRHADRFLFMSATFPEMKSYCHMLGIPQSQVQWVDLPSPFPVEIRPITYLPVADMSYKINEIDHCIAEIKSILAKHRNEKGIIHAVSYKLRDRIIQGIDDKRLIKHESNDKEAVIQAFKSSKYPYVLVSPSMERGVSLDYDQARFIIIPKVPYQSTQDRVVNARLHSGWRGQEWYRADAAQRIVQMAGRGVRAVDDYCQTYILDKQFTRLLQKPRLFPGWFLEAVNEPW